MNEITKLQMRHNALGDSLDSWAIVAETAGGVVWKYF